MGSSGLQPAAETARTLEAALLVPSEHIVVHKGPQQNNTSDCGIFVLATAELLGQRVALDANVSPEGDGWLREMVTAEFATQLRKKVYELIQSLRQTP